MCTWFGDPNVDYGRRRPRVLDGVLVKNAEAWERLEKVTTLVLDKTGTLTEGKPQLLDVCPAVDISASELLHWAASLEQNSGHPLATAIVQVQKNRTSHSIWF